MSVNKDRLTAARDNIIAQIEEMTRSPKPSYSIDGESWSWKEYFEMLTTQAQNLRQMIDDEDGDSIVEIHSELI